MRALITSALFALGLSTAAQAQQALTATAADVIFPITSPTDLTPMANGSVRFKGTIAGADSELRSLSGRSCAFQNVDLRTGRVTYQVNFGQAEPDFSTRPSRFGYAAIRLTGQGVYCSVGQDGATACNDVYDITVWGEGDLRTKVRALRKLNEAGCLRG